jgi:hypothetical protein
MIVVRQAITSRAQGDYISYQGFPTKRTAGVAAISAFVIVVLIGVAIATAHLMRQLDTVSANLTRVSSSLDTLKSMNQKLVMLNGMSVTLHQMNDKLSVTNRSLDAANQKFSSMARYTQQAGSNLNGMRRSLGDMQGDIRTMSAKISGSFLFRSVKTH